MPNWCDNRLYIHGDIETIKTFVEKTRNTEEVAEKRRQRYDILQNLYPTPQELTDTVSGFFGNDTEKQAELEAKQTQNRAKYGAKDWYDWQNMNWGTKWGDSDTDLLDENPFVNPDGKGHITYVFQSAWCPPLEGFTHISTLFPSLEFGLAYYEEGCDFYGFATFSDGDVLDNCEEISSISGMAELDALEQNEDNDIDIWEKRNDLICEARDRLTEEAGF